MKAILLVPVIFMTTLLHGQDKPKVMPTINAKEQSLICKLTSKELQERKQTVLADLKKKVLSKKELEDGFQYSFTGTDEMLDQLALFIKTERQCCDFFDYQILVNGDGAQIELKITGPSGAKDFIKDELGL